MCASHGISFGAQLLMSCSKCPDLLSRSVDHKKHVCILPRTSSAVRSTNFLGRIMIFIITILLLAADFYYIKNIAGRRLVGLRWWNEVDPQTGESQWVFESSEPGTKTVNPTDSRFFWLALYIQPMLWVLMAILALVRLQFLWLPLVGTLDRIPLESVIQIQRARFETMLDSVPLTLGTSYCSCPHHHEHSSLLTM